MTEQDVLVAELLEKHTPLRLDAEPDWSDVLRRAGCPRSGTADAMEATVRAADQKRGVFGRAANWSGLRGRRRVLVPAVVLVLMAGVAATAFAGIRLFTGPPEPSEIDTTAAAKLVEYTLTADFSVWSRGDTIAVWRVPQPNGSLCVFTALASPKPTAPGSGRQNPAGGGFCNGTGEQLPPGKTIGVTFAATQQPGGGYSWLIQGPVHGVETLELWGANGRIPIAYGNGWFLSQLPLGSSAQELPQGGPFVLVAYDADGSEMMRLDLQEAKAGPRVR